MEVRACDPALREAEAGKHELEANMDLQMNHSYRVRPFLKGEEIINLPVSRQAKRKGTKRKKLKKRKEVGELSMYPAGQQLNTVTFYYC